MMQAYSRAKTGHLHEAASGQLQSSPQGAGQLVDMRPKAATQARLQEMADSGFRSNRQMQLYAAAGERLSAPAHSLVVQRAKSQEDADAEMAAALGRTRISDQEEDATEEDAEPGEYYLRGDMEGVYIESADMAAMMAALDQYMSLELDGLEPTPSQMQTLSDGWIGFNASFDKIMAVPHYGNGAPFMIKKALRTKKAQPEMPAGKTIPEIILFLKSKNGEVCNQSIGGGILEILGEFRSI